MAQTASPKQSIAEALKAAQTVVITAHKGPDADAVGSSLALARVLEKLGKKVHVVLADAVPEAISWLPGADRVQSSYTGGRNLRIEVGAGKDAIEALRYETEGETLSIVIEPKAGPIAADSVKVRGGAEDYDLLVVLDTPTLEYTGETGITRGDQPVVVIDHHPTNTRFGTENWVDQAAASTSEMLVSLFDALGGDLLDAETATNLLAGLLYDTGGFRNDNTRASSFQVASRLIEAGADHGRLTRELLTPRRAASTLRLWGRALASLRAEPETGLAWAQVTSADLLEEGSPESWGVSSLMDSLLKPLEGVRLVLLLTEPEPGVVQGSLRVPSGQQGSAPDAAAFAASLGGGGHKMAAGFRLEQTLDEAIGEVLPKLRAYLQSGALTTEAPKPEPKAAVQPSSEDRPAPKPRPASRLSEEVTEPELPTSAAEHLAPTPAEPEIGVWQADDEG